LRKERKSEREKKEMNEMKVNQDKHSQE